MRGSSSSGLSRVFRHELRVRYSECDPQGVVFNANYVAYFDVVMTELWREGLGSYHDLLDAGVDMVVAELNVRFLGPARFDDVLAFEARLARLGETSITTRVDATTSDHPVVEGTLRHVFIDVETKRKRQIPDYVRRALTRYADLP